MIVTRILGGLGNQMFQYAMGRALALRRDTELVLDTSWYGGGRPAGDTPRTFGLDAFRVEARVLPPQAGGIPASAEPGMPCTFHFHQSSVALEADAVTLTYLSEGSQPIDSEAISVPGSLYLNGFWQDEAYFDDAVLFIRNEFRLSRAWSQRGAELFDLIVSRENKSPLVSIHVRRGDYVTSPATAAWHGQIEPSWYAEAIRRILERSPEARFVVFSEDVDWCRANLPHAMDTIFVGPSAASDAEQLVLMSQCSHHIIANSSFSWWGAWLNPNLDKVVIAPKRWTLAEPSRPSPVPKSWIVL